MGGLLGEEERPGPGDDRAYRFYGLLRWLAGRSRAPLLLALDDLHWADADSLALTSFIGRRVASLPVGVIATVRPWPAEALEVALRLAHEGTASIVRLSPLSSGPQTDNALESLTRSGLIESGPRGDADFVHPLFRRALYFDLAAPVRARLHARAFGVYCARGLDAQAAEHAVRAGLTGDPRAAAVLERAGLAALRSGALATAVTRLDAAVSLAGEEASTRLLLAQGEALLAGSGPARAIEVYDRVLARPDIPADDRVTASWMLGKTRFLAGAHDAAAAAFDQAARLALPGAPGVAVEVLLDAAFSAWLTTGPGHALPLAARAVALAVPLEPHVRDRAQAEWGQIALQTGDPSGVDAAAAAAVGAGPGHGAGSAAPASQTQAAWDAASAFAGAACLVERTAESHASFTALRAAAEQAANPTAIAFLANKHAYTLTRMGRLEEAMAALDVALSLADVVPPMESFSGVGAAYIGLYMGRLDDSARWCERVEAGATARGEWNALLFLWDVLGHRRLREGAVTEACGYYERLEAAVRRMGIGEPCLPPWGRHGIGAYLAAGRQDDARRVIAWLDRSARRLPCRFPRIAAAAGRAQLAEQAGRRDEAEAHFRAALVLHEEVDLPLEKAETLLGYGSFLRRCGTLARARPVLAETMQVAEACKAGWLARLAHDELRIAGGRRRRGSSAALTAQEQRVADLAATGASNREIARQLYLSVSTIETHLERRLRQAGHPLPAPADRPGQRFGRFPDDTGSRPGPRCQ